MRLKVVIVDLEVSRQTQRKLITLGLPLLILLTAGVAYAASLKANWQTGDVLAAADLDNNFSQTESRLESLEARAKSNANSTLTSVLTSSGQSCDAACENKTTNGTCVGAVTLNDGAPGSIGGAWHPCGTASNPGGVVGNLACYCAVWNIQ